MTAVSIDTPLFVRKLDCIETTSGTLLKRGCTALLVEGAEYNSSVDNVIRKLADAPVSMRELAREFKPNEFEVFAALLRRLLDLGLVEVFTSLTSDLSTSNSEESPLELFFWDMKTDAREVRSSRSNFSIVLVGSNEIVRKIGLLIANLSANQISSVADSSLSDEMETQGGAPVFDGINAGNQITGSSIVIAVSMDGSVDRLLHWNATCHHKNAVFVPVLFENLTALIGPIYEPGCGGPCYQCFIDRQRSAIELDETKRALFSAALDSRRETMSSSESVLDFVAQVAALQIEKLISGYNFSQRGGVTDVRPLIPSVVQRRVLRAPRCSVCSDFMARPQLNEV